MHGLTTINRINADNQEARRIMAAKGIDLPVFGSDEPLQQPVHVPLGLTYAQVLAGEHRVALA